MSYDKWEGESNYKKNHQDWWTIKYRVHFWLFTVCITLVRCLYNPQHPFNGFHFILLREKEEINKNMAENFLVIKCYL